MSKSTEGRTIPQSVRHKRILTLAEERPDASLEALADEIPTATADLIEHVLDKYGDPAAEEHDDHEEGTTDGTDDTAEDEDPLQAGSTTNAVKTENGTDPSEEQPTEENEEGEQPEGPDELPSGTELTAAQRATLREIRANPNATQRDLGETLGVSAATISTRVNAIEGFDWADRAELAAQLLEDTQTTEESNEMSTDDTTANGQLEAVTERLDALEERVDDQFAASETTSVFADAEFTHKVIHACMESDRLSEEEELRLLRGILHHETP